MICVSSYTYHRHFDQICQAFLEILFIADGARMPRAVKKKADRKGKSEVSRSISTDRSEANNSLDSITFWRLPWRVAAIRELSKGPKGLYAKLNTDATGRSWCRVGVRSLAKSLGVDKSTISEWIKKLESLGLIKVRHERACCRYYMIPRYRVGGFIPLLANVLKRRDVGWSYKILMCSLSYKLADNDSTWVDQKDLAEDLGISVRTVQRVLAGMKARCEVQIRLRGRNRKQGNKYALTCGALLGGRIFGAVSHTTKYPLLYKKWKAKSYLKALRANFHPDDLSASGSNGGFAAEAVFDQLVGCGIHEKVARPLAFVDKHPFESAVQAVNNAQILRAQKWKRCLDAGLPRQKFSVPGYVVNALNGARREGKIVGTTRLFRQAGDMYWTFKKAKAKRRQHPPPGPAEIAARVRKAKRALGVGT